MPERDCGAVVDISCSDYRYTVSTPNQKNALKIATRRATYSGAQGVAVRVAVNGICGGFGSMKLSAKEAAQMLHRLSPDDYELVFEVIDRLSVTIPGQADRLACTLYPGDPSLDEPVSPRTRLSARPSRTGSR